MLRPKPAPVSVHDGVELELPLKVLAPLFFASQKAARLAKQKVSVSAEIPNLFKNAEAAISPAPASAPATVPAPAPTAPAELAETNHFPRPEAPASGVFQRQASPGTDFLSRGVTPREAVARALKLPGVTGAVVALYDGLLIAGQLPEDLNADTVAAILPQIFARTGESVTELRMGELNNLSFTAGDVPWKIFRVNAVYFAVLGRAGEALPAEPLMALAGQLDRKNK
jgi:predicted regulator of Ras-like GTPase activity (Roadblock/LC7/MglB family)